MRVPFPRGELGLIASAAALVFTRVLAITLPFVGFTEFAAALPGAVGSPHADLLAGLAFGVYGLTLAAAQLGSGILSDRVGRRPVLLAGSALFVAGSLVAWLAPDIWTLMVGRLLQGLGGVSSVAMAAVGESVPAERRTSAMALVGVPAGLGAFLGIVLGPPLASLVGFRGLFLVTAALGAAAGLPFLLRRRASLPAPGPPPAPALGRSTSLGLPALALGLAGFASSFAMGAIFVQYQSEVAPRFPHLLLALALGVALVGVGLVSKAIDRRGATWVPVVAALAVVAAAAPLFRLGDALALTLPAACLFFLGHAVLSSTLPSQVSRLAGRMGGRGHGVQLVFASLGAFAGPALAGAAAPARWPAFVALAALAVLAAALVATALRRPAAHAGAAQEVPAP